MSSRQSSSRQLIPHSTISLGKYGSVQANLLLGRPFHITYEVLDLPKGQKLRVVPATELHADALADSPAVDTPDREIIDADGGVTYELVGEDGEVVMRTNRNTNDDPGRQKLTMEEIERLKIEGGSAGRDLISKLLLSHSALNEKTTFSLAKYTLRKSRKFLKRFTVLPLDVPTLAEYMYAEKDASKIMELTGEMIGLMGSFANVHYAAVGGNGLVDLPENTHGGRWLVVDETGGLVVAAMAERMGILYAPPKEERPEPAPAEPQQSEAPPSEPTDSIIEGDAPKPDLPIKTKRSILQPLYATSNTLTLLHANTQPNLSLLRYFNFDPNEPTTTHPLNTHLKTLNWLQVLSPEADPACIEPPVPTDAEYESWKSGKKSSYHRKRRRWERTMGIVTETRAGGFDGLLIASVMDPRTILTHLIPLLRGGANAVVYSPHIEPLVELADLYSTSRRAAFLNNPPSTMPCDDFPINPALLLAPTIHASRARRYQCLPGRTHPLMTARGGGEGYLFVATRVLPAEGGVRARGNFQKKKKGESEVVVKDGGSGKRGIDDAAQGDGKRAKVDAPAGVKDLDGPDAETAA